MAEVAEKVAGVENEIMIIFAEANNDLFIFYKT